MAFGKTNATSTPRMLGVQVTTSVYNSAIQLIIGTRRTAGRLIWYGYFGPGDSGKKGKSGKKGITNYKSNVDLLLGYGPLWNLLSTWNNSNICGYGKDQDGNNLSPFNHTKTQTFAVTAGDFTVNPDGTWTYTGSVSNVPSGNFLDYIQAISFTPTTPLSATVNDYGDPLSPKTITETVAEEFLYNVYDNYGSSGPGAVAWRPGSWALGKPLCTSDKCTFPIGTDAGGVDFTVTLAVAQAGTVTVYYGYTKNDHDTPVSWLNYEFESELGSGNEYNGSLSSQQITYPELSGAGGINIDLGATATAPELDIEAQGLYSLFKDGSANPADLILDLILSGNIFFNNNDGTFNPLCFSHGLNFGGDPSRTDLVTGDTHPGSYPWPPAVTFPHVVPGNGLFQILRDPPQQLFGIWSNSFNYPQGAIVKFTDNLYYKCKKLTIGAQDPTNPDYWQLFTGEFSDGLMDVRNYCAANGISISCALQSSSPASDILDTVCQIANCVAVWNGQTLDFYPYSEVSAVGGGALYTPRSSAPGWGVMLWGTGPWGSGNPGPLLQLDSRYFVCGQDEAPVTVKQSGLQQVYNILDVNYADRGDGGDGSCGYQSYQSNSVRICDGQHSQIYGAMNGSPLGFDEFLVSADAATKVGWPIMKRQRFADPYLPNFRLPASVASLLDPMDLLNLVEPSIFGGVQPDGTVMSGSGQQAVRIRTLTENDSGVWDLECERYLYGMSAPAAPSVTSSTPTTQPQQLTPAGDVNAPYFFEPTPALATALGMTDVNGICIAVSGSASNYGGCQVLVSTDGGATYQMVGAIKSQPAMGTVVSDYPSAVSPDGTNTLHLDLSESNGELQSWTSDQQNQLVPLAILDGGGTAQASGYNLDIPYEVISYGAVSLVGSELYDAVPPILRGQLGSVPADHPTDSVFVDLSNPTLIFKFQVPSGKIVGNTLHFKFPTFNQYGTALEDEADCTDYTYSLTGQTNPGQNSTYTISPNPALSQGNQALGSGNNDATKVYVPALTVNFPTGQVSYSAASATAFSNPSGGETVFVSIHDPSMSGGAPTLDIQSTNVHATTPGYIFLGQITSIAWTGSPGSGSGGTAGGTTGGSTGAGGPQDIGQLVITVDGVPV